MFRLRRLPIVYRTIVSFNRLFHSNSRPGQPKLRYYWCVFPPGRFRRKYLLILSYILFVAKLALRGRILRLKRCPTPYDSDTCFDIAYQLPCGQSILLVYGLIAAPVTMLDGWNDARTGEKTLLLYWYQLASYHMNSIIVFYKYST